LPEIGVVADPLNWSLWEQAKAFLEPARARGDFPDVIEPDEELFAVLDGGELIACATAWFNVDGKYVEVALVGGKDRHRWLEDLDREIGAAARAAGATRLTACGRRGWLRELSALGWERIGDVDAKTLLYSRELGE
jgi:hypothetical protein